MLLTLIVQIRKCVDSNESQVWFELLRPNMNCDQVSGQSRRSRWNEIAHKELAFELQYYLRAFGNLYDERTADEVAMKQVTISRSIKGQRDKDSDSYIGPTIGHFLFPLPIESCFKSLEIDCPFTTEGQRSLNLRST